MSFSLKLITPPTVEPVTVSEVKLHAHIDYDVEDSILTSWIRSARQLAENYQHRAYLSQVWELTFDDFPADVFDVYRSPIISLDSVTYYDDTNNSHSIATTSFIVDAARDPARIALLGTNQWPTTTLRTIAGLVIRYTAGYGATAASVPDTVKDAIMLYCAYRNDNRAAESGSAPKQFYDLLTPERIYMP